MKSVIITGSTKGIGRGMAENFLKRGCRVVISSRTESDVQKVSADLAKTYGRENVMGKACDITSPEALTALFEAGAAAFGSVDVWVNNAGMSIKRAPLHEQSIADITAIATVNLTGALLANSIVGKAMVAQGHGQIWNMEGFGSGGQVQPGMTAYGATKRAVNYINKAMQKDLKGTNVQVCTVSPGIVVTDLLIGDYDLESPDWQKSKKIFNILGDTVETVTPYLVDGILKTNKSGGKVVWLTGGKAFLRFLTAAFNKRDLFAELEKAA